MKSFICPIDFFWWSGIPGIDSCPDWPAQPERACHTGWAPDPYWDHSQPWSSFSLSLSVRRPAGWHCSPAERSPRCPDPGR